MTEQKTNATDWRVGDKINKKNYDGITYIGYVEEDGYCLTVNSSHLLDCVDNLSEFQEDYENIDATIRAKDVEIAALKAQIADPWCYDLDKIKYNETVFILVRERGVYQVVKKFIANKKDRENIPNTFKAWMPIPQAPKGETA